MKYLALCLLLTALFTACKNESNTKVKEHESTKPQVESSRLDRLTKEGLRIIDTTIFIPGFKDLNPTFTVKFNLDGADLFILGFDRQISSDLNLPDFILYDATNNEVILVPQLTAGSWTLSSILPNPTFIVKANLPDSAFDFEWQDYIEQTLFLEKGYVKFKNRLLYSPPKIPQEEIDSLISEFENQPVIDQNARDTIKCIDEMYFTKIFLESIKGNPKCEEILSNLTDKFLIDGAIAESYLDFLYLDELLKNKK